jgi:hypothetical protein
MPRVGSAGPGKGGRDAAAAAAPGPAEAAAADAAAPAATLAAAPSPTDEVQSAQPLQERAQHEHGSTTVGAGKGGVVVGGVGHILRGTFAFLYDEAAARGASASAAESKQADPGDGFVAAAAAAAAKHAAQEVAEVRLHVFDPPARLPVYACALPGRLC